MRIALTSDVHRGASKNTHLIHDKFFRKLEADKEWDVLLIAGDIGLYKTEQMKWFFTALRHRISRPVVCVRGNHDYWHDPKPEWTKDSPFKHRPEPSFKAKRSVQVCNEYHQLYFKTYEIHHLEDNPYLDDGVAIVGWDGWYPKPPIEMNCTDHEWMPAFVSGTKMMTHEYLSRKNQKDILTVIDAVNELHSSHKIVLVNHMPIIDLHSHRHGTTHLPVLWDEVKTKISAYCYGHVHQANTTVIDNVRVYSADVHYDRPGYLTFEV